MSSQDDITDGTSKHPQNSSQTQLSNLSLASKIKIPPTIESSDLVPYYSAITSKCPDSATIITENAQVKIFSHFFSYPETMICGLIIGQQNDNGYTITDIVPVSHSSFLSSSIFESAIEITNKRLYPVSSIPSTFDDLQESVDSFSKLPSILGIYTAPDRPFRCSQQVFESLQTLMPIQNTSNGSIVKNNEVNLNNDMIKSVLHANVRSLPDVLFSLLVQLTTITPSPLLLILDPFALELNGQSPTYLPLFYTYQLDPYITEVDDINSIDLPDISLFPPLSSSSQTISTSSVFQPQPSTLRCTQTQWDLLLSTRLLHKTLQNALITGQSAKQSLIQLIQHSIGQNIKSSISFKDDTENKDIIVTIKQHHISMNDIVLHDWSATLNSRL